MSIRHLRACVVSALFWVSLAISGEARAEGGFELTLIRGEAKILRATGGEWVPIAGPNLPKDFKPSKATAKGTFSHPDLGVDVVYTLTFWDAGAMLTSKTAEVEIIQDFVNKATRETIDTRTTTCTFSGGPSGKFHKDADTTYGDTVSYVDHAGIDGQLNGITGDVSFFWYLHGQSYNGNLIKVAVEPTDIWSAFPDTTVEPLEITINDKIMTGENTRMELKFPDGSIFRVKSNSVFSLLKGGIQLQVGEAWFNLQKQGSTFQVVTPTTLCGVLGTSFSVSVDDVGNTEVLLFEGTLQVTDAAQGTPVTLVAGQKLTATSAGLDAPVALTEGETSAAWDASWQDQDPTSGAGGCSIRRTGTGAGVDALLIVATLALLFVAARSRERCVADRQG